MRSLEKDEISKAVLKGFLDEEIIKHKELEFDKVI